MNCQVKQGTIFYEEYGQGHPLIILHAMGTDHQSMKEWLEPVFQDKPGWKRYYVDIPAHGRSSIRESVKGTEDMLGMLLEFIDTQLPNQKFSMIGMSFGGYLAQGIIHHRKELVEGICLIAPSIHKPGADKVLPANIKMETNQQLTKDLDADILQAFNTLIVYQNELSLKRFMEEIQPGRLLADRNFLGSNWRENFYYYSFEPLGNMDQISHPALFVLGKQDLITGYEDQIGLYKKFEHATVAILDKAGHIIPIDQRNLVQQLVGEWLLRVRTTEAAPTP